MNLMLLVTGFPGNQYKAFPTRAEAERYVQDFVKSVEKRDTVQEISNRNFQASPISKLEPNKVIKEEDGQFVVFESILHFDKHFESLVNFYEGEKAKIGERLPAYLDCDRKGIKELQHKGGTVRPKECCSARSRLAKSHLNHSVLHDFASTPLGVDNKSDQLSFPQESCTGTQCIAPVRKLKDGVEFLCFENESVLENYLKPFSDAKNWSNALSHSLQPHKSSQAKLEESSICTCEHLSCQSDQLFPDVIYQLEFDGASKGNPGRAGAGALLRNPDGSVAFQLMESLGVTTNNVAEYCSLILGLRGALARGAKKVRVQGDSKLVCLQVRGIWKLKNEKLIPLCNIAKQLMEKFEEFSITHVERELNSAADALANAAIFQLETNFAREILSIADPNLQ